MMLFVIWLVVFAVILALTIKAWPGIFGSMVDRLLPAVLRSEDDRWIWCPAFAAIVATAIVSPIDMLMTLLIMAIIVGVGGKLGCWIMSKVKMH
uniref:hypothetical protein n=1 Tax=Halomonas sp. TaxID=1486246 RepID=UPI00262A95D3|nr:hypothetical protein [Halomonas sp.]